MPDLVDAAVSEVGPPIVVPDKPAKAKSNAKSKTKSKTKSKAGKPASGSGDTATDESAKPKGDTAAPGNPDKLAAKKAKKVPGSGKRAKAAIPADGSTTAKKYGNGSGGKKANPATARKTAADTRSGSTPDDGERWSAFAPAPKGRPSRVAVVAGGIGRFLGHEWTLAALGSVLLAALMTWPTLRHPTKTIPQDPWDPVLQAWEMAWAGHALTHNPFGLWHSNTFFPERYTFAFSDTLLGYAPLSMIGTGVQAAVFRYNVLYVLVFALAFFGGYVLLRQLGAQRAAALVAAAAFGYAPWRLGQAGHMHVISTGGIALALAMLARGHGWSLRHGYRPERVKPGWALAGWLVAAWQMTLGFGIGLPFAYVLMAVVATSAVWWQIRRRPAFSPRLVRFDLIGAVVFGTVSLTMAYPYLRVISLFPYARRTEGDLFFSSPPLKGFFIAPPESLIWGDLHASARAGLAWPPETAMLIGFVLFGLAVAGLVVSIWTPRQRLLLGTGAAVSIFWAMGTSSVGGGIAGYLLLYRYLPGFDAIRTSGRLVIWSTLLLGILAAGAVGALATRARQLLASRGLDRPLRVLGVITLLPALLVLVEGLNQTPHAVVPTAPAALRTVQGPYLILPSDQLNDEQYMLWTADGFPKVVNGGSGFTPQRQAEIRKLTEHFPDPGSIDALRTIGVRTVVVVKSRAAGTPYSYALRAPIEGLDVRRQDRGDVVVFTLTGG